MEVGNCFVWDKATSDSKQESSPNFQPESGGHSILSPIELWSDFCLCDFCLCLSGQRRCPTNVGPMWDLLKSSRGTTLLPFSDPAYQCLPPTPHLTFPLHVSSFSSLSFVLYSAIPLSQRGATLPNLTSPPTQLGIKRFVNSPPPRPPRSPPFASIYGRPQALFVSLEATYRAGLGRSLDPLRDTFFVFGEATTYLPCDSPHIVPQTHIGPLPCKTHSDAALAKRYLNFFIQPVLPKHVQIFLSN